jgi:hypothetical protein
LYNSIPVWSGFTEKAYESEAKGTPVQASASTYLGERSSDMFHVIVVDDESAALKRFERIASGIPGISMEGKFLYADDAIAFVREQRWMWPFST